MDEIIETMSSTVVWKGDGEFTGHSWRFECAFCDYEVEFKSREWAQQEMRIHGKKHYDHRSGLYRSDEGLRVARENHRKYRQMTGDYDTVRRMNKEGL